MGSQVITHKTPIALCRALYRDVTQRRLSKAMMHEPICELDTLLFGRTWDFWQDACQEPAEDGPFWATRSTLCELRADRPDCTAPPPMHMLTGWHDFFAAQSLMDYERAAALQPACRLTVMPFEHWGFARVAGMQARARNGARLSALAPPRLHAESPPLITCMQLMFKAILECFDDHLPTTAATDSAAQPSERTRRPLLPIEWVCAGRSAASLAKPVQLSFLGTNRWRESPTRVPTRAPCLSQASTPSSRMKAAPTCHKGSILLRWALRRLHSD